MGSRGHKSAYRRGDAACAVRQPWTPEQAAEYAARRDFRLIEMLSKNRRAEATARRLGVFSAFPSSSSSLSGMLSGAAAKGGGARERDPREPSKRQQKQQKRSAGRAALYQSQVARARGFFRRSSFAAGILSSVFSSWRRQLPRHRRLQSTAADCDAGASSSSSSAPPPPPSQPGFGSSAWSRGPPPSLSSTKRGTGDRSQRAVGDPQTTPDAKRSQVARADPDVQMHGEAPSSPPRDYAQAERELLLEASETLAARSGAQGRDDHYSLRSPQGRGKGKGGR